jgi:hypothetical protein
MLRIMHHYLRLSIYFHKIFIKRVHTQRNEYHAKKNTKPVLLFDYGETLVQYLRWGEFPAILRESINQVKTAVLDLGYAVPSDLEIQRRVQAENHESKNGRVRPLEMRLSHIFGLKRGHIDQSTWFEICRAFLQPFFAVSKIYPDTHPALDHFGKQGYRIGILSNSPWGAPSQSWCDELARMVYGIAARRLSFAQTWVGANPPNRSSAGHCRTSSARLSGVSS